MTVTASYIDSFGNLHSVTSAARGPVGSVNDLPTGTVTISGSATEDETLTASNTLSDEDGIASAISYQWNRDGVLVPGATGTTYTLTQSDVGSTITVTASYTDGGGQAENMTSSATATVANINDSPTGAVTMSGTAQEDVTLTVSNNLSDEDGLGVISYQWKRSGEAIVGATATSYTLTQADVGSTITVTASYTDGGGQAENMTSSATATVANVNLSLIHI